MNDLQGGLEARPDVVAGKKLVQHNNKHGSVYPLNMGYNLPINRIYNTLPKTNIAPQNDGFQ